MTDEHAKTLVEHRLQKAEDALRAAQYMYEQSMLIFLEPDLLFDVLCSSGITGHKRKIVFQGWSGKRVFQSRIC